MLPACAHSFAEPQALPVVKTVHQIERICAPEIMAGLPPSPAMPANARIEAPDGVLQWISARFAREALLEARIVDARGFCAAKAMP